MKERYLPESDTFADILLDDIDIAYSIFNKLLEKLTCLHRHIEGFPLNLSQKEELYRMADYWINTHLTEKDTKKIRKILPIHTFPAEQLDDRTINDIFPQLEKIFSEYPILWYLLDQTATLLEKEARTLFQHGQLYKQAQTYVEKEREHFIIHANKLFKTLMTQSPVPHKRHWIETYARLMQKHRGIWDKSNIPFKTSQEIDLDFLVDLSDMDLRELDLSHVPLQQANLRDSRLAGSILNDTHISAVQLARAREFSQIRGISKELCGAAQNECYQHWLQRLFQRNEQVDRISKSMRTSQTSETQGLSTLESALKQCEHLLHQQRLLTKHTVNFAVAPEQLRDLREEQKNALFLRLKEIEQKENSLQEELHHFVFKARLALCHAYFKRIESTALAEDSSTESRQFDKILALCIFDPESIPLPSEWELKILARRDHFLSLELAQIRQLLLNFTEKDSDMIGKALERIHSVIGKTLRWPLLMELETAINKVKRDWIRCRITNKIENDQFEYAKKLIAELLSDAAIAQKSQECINELRGYEISTSDHYGETYSTSENSETAKIYICQQKDCLFLDQDGIIYRWALSNEQIAMIKKLAAPLDDLAFRQSILSSAAKHFYHQLRFELKLKIVEKWIEKNELHDARQEMQKIITEAIVQKYTLDLRKRPPFRNEAFWQGISLYAVRIYLDFGAAQALGERRIQYNAALFIAIEKGDLEEVKYGIERFYWSAYLRNKDGCSSVIFACLHGHFDMARYLHDNGGEIANIKPVGEIDINPLDELVQKYKKDPSRYEPIILWLIDNGLEFEPRHALGMNNVELFQRSLVQLIDADTRQQKMRQLLEIAIQEGADTVVREIWKHEKECIHSFPLVAPKTIFSSFFNDDVIDVPEAFPLLHLACAAGQISIVNLFLHEPSTSGSENNKQSALLYLAKVFIEKYSAKNKDLAEFEKIHEKWQFIALRLCRYGAKHTIKTWIFFQMNLDDVKLYIHKDTINKPCDDQGNTPLHLAVKIGNIALVQFLIQHKVEIEPVNFQQETPLYLACQQGHAKILTCLLEAKANSDGPRRDLTVNEREQLVKLADTFPEMRVLLNKRPLIAKKETPLHLAILDGKTAIVEILCARKADVEEKYEGKTALHLALYRRNYDIAVILLHYNASLHALNNNGESLWQVAVRTYQVEMLMLLLDAYVNQVSFLHLESVQRDILAYLDKDAAKKEKFCAAMTQWAEKFKPALKANEPLTREVSLPSRTLSGPSLNLSSSLPSATSLYLSSSSSSLSSSSSSLTQLSIFSPTNRQFKRRLPGEQFDVHLSAYFETEKKSSGDNSSPTTHLEEWDLPDYDEPEEMSLNIPPESIVPFYMIPSDSEEIEEEEKVVSGSSLGRFGK